MFFDEYIPSSDLLVETGDVLERIVGGNLVIEDAQEAIEYFRILRGLGAETAVRFGDSTVKRCCLVIFPETLQGEGFVELNDVGGLAAIFPFVIVEAD